jgi:cysteine desulfurase family protein (TIGR01976 family)
MHTYLLTANSNKGGAFHTSKLTDHTVQEARSAMADMFNAISEDEIVFGPNMTTLTFSISRSIGKTMKRGDEIIVTRMDHDANIAPWLLMAEDRGVAVRWADWNEQTGKLDYEQFGSLISSKTRLIACVYASNALGTINDVEQVVAMAKSVGALTYIDAVQYAAHGSIDVQALDVDFLVASSYKFFGPHAGILYGKRSHLEALSPYKVRPAPENAPDRWETGTASFEALAGITEAVNYLAWVGESFGPNHPDRPAGRRQAVRRGMLAIRQYEKDLSRALLEGLREIPGITIQGIGLEGLDDRVPTIIFNLRGKAPLEVAEQLGEQQIYVWDGDYYAFSVMERLGLKDTGGMVRVGAVHYNTIPEVNRLLNELERIANS